MTLPPNYDRAARAQETLDQYLDISGSSPEYTLIDLLTDVMHLCDLGPILFDHHPQTAKMHFEAEQSEET